MEDMINSFEGGREVKKRKDTITGILFSLPAILGFLCFALGPMVVSFILGFTDYSISGSATFCGLDNYKKMFTGGDVFFFKALSVTIFFAFLNVAVCMITGFLIALLLNSKMIKRKAALRAIFYIPTIIPYVATAMIFMWMMSPDFGLFNILLKQIGLEGSKWIYDEKTVLPSLLFITAWTAGNVMVVFLAGLQGVPGNLYEAVEIDGGGFIRKFQYVTLPMMTPIIFFNGLMFLIASMQGFMPAAVITQGGPNNATLFYTYYMYKQAFEFSNLGYASALGWVLFLVIAILAAIIFKTSKYWVFYSDEG
ncbi:carbohydrate ABC transporter permease [Muricoprocola aceti]|uniref:Sugar ABC transporter permease n=1 Tax=Muricoprocola aceti TaxID=2981772 RepID=A0ABT2SJ06_9FIRM|nr:sugar ABC transporter permease [Muricoprocola aceti]MCU6724484.1 sugar ABC transporter permease [Muricoprocola aceti]